MIREPYNLNPYNSTIDTSKVNNFSFTFSGDELGSWNIEIAKNNTSPEIVYTSEEFVPEDVGYTHIYDDDIVEGITLPSTIAHSQGDDGLLRRLYSINGYPFNEAVVKLNVNGIENIGNIKGSTTNGYLVATNYSLGRTGDGVTIIGFDKDGTTIGSQVTDGTYDFLGYLLSVKTNSNIQVGQAVQIEGNSFIIGSIEDVGDGYSELTIVNGEATFSDTASIASFDSLAEADVTELTVGIEPVQDLNGYDAPWVGGAGKNKLNYDAWKTVSIVKGTAVWENNGVTLTSTDDDCYTSYGGSTFPQGARVSVTEGETVILSWDFERISGASGGNVYIFPNGSSSGWVTAGISEGQCRYTVASGVTYITFRFGIASTGTTIAFKNVQITKGTTAPTSYSPYSNICPITGHDEATVTRTGKNLCAPRDVDSNIYNAGHLISVTQGETIYVYGEWTWTVSGNLYGRVFDDKDATNKNADGANPSPNYFNSDTVFSMTMPRDGYFGVCYSAGVSSYTINKMMVSRVPITSYEPYQSNTYTTSLGQTVYGGTLDMVTGVLTVDKAIVDLGTLTWSLNSSLNGKPAFYVRLYDAKTVSASSVADMTTSCYSVISADNLYIQKDNTGIITLNSQNYLQVRDTRYSTASAYKSGITGQTLVYELATPLTYTLTAQQIKTLVGTNNVWASSGDIVNITFTYETN